MEDQSNDQRMKEKKSIIEKEGFLFCPSCKRFTPFSSFKFYGKDFSGKTKESENSDEIMDFEGYRYRCDKCHLLVDSSKMERIEV